MKVAVFTGERKVGKKLFLATYAPGFRKICVCGLEVLQRTHFSGKGAYTAQYQNSSPLKVAEVKFISLQRASGSEICMRTIAYAANVPAIAA